MELLASFYTPQAYDAYTFVFDEPDDGTGYYPMLGMSEDGRSFCQWTQGLYDPASENAQLGYRIDVRTLSAAVRGQLDEQMNRSALRDEVRADGGDAR